MAIVFFGKPVVVDTSGFFAIYNPEELQWPEQR